MQTAAEFGEKLLAEMGLKSLEEARAMPAEDFLNGVVPRRLGQTLAAAAGLVGWGGVSVQFQTLALLSDSSTKGALHLAGRLSSALLSFCLAYLLFRFRS